MKEIRVKMPFDYWFSQSSNSDIRMPLMCPLSFVSKLSNDDWIELTKYIFKKCQEAQGMWGHEE